MNLGPAKRDAATVSCRVVKAERTRDVVTQTQYNSPVSGQTLGAESLPNIVDTMKERNFQIPPPGLPLKVAAITGR